MTTQAPAGSRKHADTGMKDTHMKDTGMKDTGMKDTGMKDTGMKDTGVKLNIDWTACDGRGLCMELVPELLIADEWGFPIQRMGRGAAVPAALLDEARDAVAACPKRALKLLPR